jgi:hypothetical protein
MRGSTELFLAQCRVVQRGVLVHESPLCVIGERIRRIKRIKSLSRLFRFLQKFLSRIGAVSDGYAPVLAHSEDPYLAPAESGSWLAAFICSVDPNQSR